MKHKPNIKNDRAWHMLDNSDLKYTHVETPQVEKNNDSRQSKPQEAKQRDLPISVN